LKKIDTFAMGCTAHGSRHTVRPRKFTEHFFVPFVVRRLPCAN